MATQTDRKRIYVCFPFFTGFAQNPRYLQYVIERLIKAGWAPVVASVYLLPQPHPDAQVMGDMIGDALGRSQALVVCFEQHMTTYMTNEIIAAKKLQFHVIEFKVSPGKMEELKYGHP